MKVKISKIVVTEDGTEITNPKAGFILMGNIFVAEVGEDDQPHGGLLGDNFCEDGTIKRLAAFTKAEMLEALGYTIEELEVILTEMRKEKSR